MIALLAKKLKYRIKIIPTKHSYRKTGKVSIRRWKLVKSCFRGAKDMLEFRMKTLFLPENEFKKAKKIRMEIDALANKKQLN